MKSAARTHIALLAMVLVVILWSAWKPHDRFTWWLEVTPGLAGIALLVGT
jgi:putative membrane protein